MSLFQDKIDTCIIMCKLFFTDFSFLSNLMYTMNYCFPSLKISIQLITHALGGEGYLNFIGVYRCRLSFV